MAKDPNLKICKKCGTPLNREIESKEDSNLCTYCAEEKKTDSHDMGHITPPMFG